MSPVQLKEGMYVWVKDPSIAGSDLYTKGHILNINANKVYSSPPLGPLTLGPGPGSGSGLRLRAQSHAQVARARAVARAVARAGAGRRAQCAGRRRSAQAADRWTRAHRMLCQTLA